MVEIETYYGAPKQRELTSLELKRVVLEPELKSGDQVNVFLTPAKKFMIIKDQFSDLRIEYLGSGYISFNKPILIKVGK